MPIAAGRLDKIVSIKARTGTRNTLNQKLLTWSTIANGDVWASIEPVRSSERNNSIAAQTEISHRVTIRYRSDVTGDMRIWYGTRQFAIRGIRNPLERGEYLEITCVEANDV